MAFSMWFSKREKIKEEPKAIDLQIAKAKIYYNHSHDGLRNKEFTFKGRIIEGFHITGSARAELFLDRIFRSGYFEASPGLYIPTSRITEIYVSYEEYYEI